MVLPSRFLTFLFSLLFVPDDLAAQPLLYLSDFTGNRVAVVGRGGRCGLNLDSPWELLYRNRMVWL